MFRVPMFSVVVPTHNRADCIAAAVESVLAQTWDDFELIVVDDGSDDETLAVLRPFRDRAVLLRQDAAGPAAARNLGVREARGRYVVFLDSDDLLAPWALATYAQIIEAEAPSMVMTRVHKFSNEEELAALSPAPLVARSYPDYLSAVPDRNPVTIAVAISRELLLEAEGFAEHLLCSEDQDLFLRLGTARGFVFVDSPRLYAYRQHEVTISRNLAALHSSLRFVLAQEWRGRYPGGRARRGQRCVVQAGMLRYGIGRCMRAGQMVQGYDLFLRGLPQLLAAGRRRKLLRLFFSPLRSALATTTARLSPGATR